MRKIKLWWHKLLCDVIGHKVTDAPKSYVSGHYYIYCARCKKYVIATRAHK